MHATSNLRSFLHCTTPVVPSKLLPEAGIRELRRQGYPWISTDMDMEIFTLRDLWNCYEEWSAYGAGVPIFLDEDNNKIVQYYVPYLSAIQIFTDNTRCFSNNFSNVRSEDTESEAKELSEDSCSSGESTGDSEKVWRSDCDRSSAECCSSFNQDSIISFPYNDRLGRLYFQYFERSAPYARIPLSDKIKALAENGFHRLMTLTSMELSPASWMAVAWYPIYHIPSSRGVKDLSACFLTYHTLSASFQEQDMDCSSTLEDKKLCKEKARKVGTALQPFGLAAYKIKRGHSNGYSSRLGELWGSGDGGKDHVRMRSLLIAADSWLRQLQVFHHDFEYFTRALRHCG